MPRPALGISQGMRDGGSFFMGMAMQPDSLMPHQWLTINHTPRQTPLMDLCQALVLDALHNLGKGTSVRYFQETLAWIEDYDGAKLSERSSGTEQYPITFETAVDLGFPTLGIGAAGLSRKIMATYQSWLGRAPIRPFHLVTRPIRSKSQRQQDKEQPLCEPLPPPSLPSPSSPEEPGLLIAMTK